MPLYHKEFSVRGLLQRDIVAKEGSQNPAITYWFEMDIGLNFMASSGLKVLLSRKDHSYEEGSSPFRCLLDKSCALAHMSEKNLLKLNVILTNGDYKLTFFEYEPTKMFSGEEDKALDAAIHALHDLARPISVRI